jgi:glycosyltransferase involved in cell wall biosynthesis
LLFLSRLVVGKGWRVFVDAVERVLAEIPTATATVAGEGEDRAEIERVLEERGLRESVRVVAASNPEDNRRLYQTHRYFLFPSAFPESLALVNLEAMASGCVVISSDFAAAREYLCSGRNGFCVNLNSFAEDSAQIVSELEQNGVELVSLSAAAKHSVEAYRESLVLESLPRMLGLI